MKRLLPTGNCWCGCGAQTDLGSFFAPGHDKRAESRLIMEVFGGVPQFLAAFGRGPDAESSSISGSWAEQALLLKGLGHGAQERVALEYTNLSDRDGPLQCTAHDVSVFGEIDLSDGSARFQLPLGGSAKTLVVVPFVDIAAVYKGVAGWVVRTVGALEFKSGAVNYIAYPHDDSDRTSVAQELPRSLRFIRNEAHRMRKHAEDLNLALYESRGDDYLLFRSSMLEAMMLRILGHVRLDEEFQSAAMELRGQVSAADDEIARVLSGVGDVDRLRRQVQRIPGSALRVSTAVDRLLG